MATIFKRDNGKFTVVIRKKGFPKRTKTFISKRNAERWAKETELKIETGVFEDGNNMSVDELLDKYIEVITPRKKTWKGETYALGVVKRHLGHITASQLNTADVVDYVDARLKSVKPATVIKEINKLSHALDTATDMWRLRIRSNPVKQAKRILRSTKTLKVDDERNRRLTPGEEKILYDSDSGHILEFAIETAMRRGEIVRLKAEHIKGSTLHIPQTKTDKPRTIPLSKRAIEILKKYPDGFGLSGPGISKRLDRLCKRNGIEDLRFHDLRHEAISRLFEKGWSIQEVAAVSGHEDWKSLKRYTNINPEKLAEKFL